jgi:hypothetical protein
MRLSPNRCVFAKAPAYQGKGRPKKHGHKMKLSDPITWAIPIESIEINGSTWGGVKIQKWSQFHFYESAEHPMEIILVQRQGKGLSQKEAKPMWLAWIGTEQPSLMSLWSLYLGFAIEHWNRFVKQRLHWTKAKLGNTESGQRWSNLMPILTWQLWLAREIIEDNPLPSAETSTNRKINTRTGCTWVLRTFSRDRHTRPTAKNQRKVPWLEKG